ncbi:hypothetical protein [Streptomyces massasporeus]|uniref:hypothetical protein n=1 Tax=Streptomyces massasporeus TaxID=67324 RepID=UPI0033F2E45A
MLRAVEPLARPEAGWPRPLHVYWLPLHISCLRAVQARRELRDHVQREVLTHEH